MGCSINCSLKSIRCYNVAKLGQRVCIDIILMMAGIYQQEQQGMNDISIHLWGGVLFFLFFGFFLFFCKVITL